MPERDLWESLLDVPLILDRFELNSNVKDVAEWGCGYGTFSVPLASRVAGTVYAYDIDPQMVDYTLRRARGNGLNNLLAAVRDLSVEGFNLPAHW